MFHATLKCARVDIPNAKQALNVVKPRLLIGCPPLGGEGVSVVFGPSAGHVLTDLSVGFATGVKSELRPVVQARCASSHEQHGEPGTRFVLGTRFRDPTVGVVVVEEGQQFMGIGVQEVLGHHFVHRANPVLPTFALFHGLLHGEVPSEVHGAIQTRDVAPAKS